MLPHQKLVLSPSKMKPQLWDAEYVPLFRINVYVIGRTGKGRRLDEAADCAWIVAFDIALEFRTKAFDRSVISGELSATASHVHRVTANEFLFSRIFQILPARHPGNRRIGDIVRRCRLA